MQYPIKLMAWRNTILPPRNFTLSVNATPPNATVANTTENIVPASDDDSGERRRKQAPKQKDEQQWTVQIPIAQRRVVVLRRRRLPVLLLFSCPPKAKHAFRVQHVPHVRRDPIDVPFECFGDKFVQRRQRQYVSKTRSRLMPLPDENIASLAVGAIKVDAEKASSLVERAVGHYALLLYFFIDWEGKEKRDTAFENAKTISEIRLTKFGTNMQPKCV